MTTPTHTSVITSAVQETRTNNEAKRAEVLDTVVSEIAGRHAHYAKVKFRHARAESIVNADAKIRDTMEEVSRVVQQISNLDLLETKKHGQHIDGGETTPRVKALTTLPSSASTHTRAHM